MKQRFYLLVIVLMVAAVVATACADDDAPSKSAPTSLNDQVSPTAQVSSTSNPEPTEPPLINTPVPVATELAPDFTLPSIQGSEYTLSDFRGEQPVLVVFYRAYW